MKRHLFPFNAFDLCKSLRIPDDNTHEVMELVSIPDGTEIIELVTSPDNNTMDNDNITGS